MAGGIDWFRWHHGSVTDPKFQLVAKKASARLGDVLAIWAFILEMASADSNRGTIGPVDFESLDFMLGADEGTSARVIEAMTARGLIFGGRIASWEKRQPKRERESDNSTPRVQALRDRMADETPCNATERHETPRVEKSIKEEKKELKDKGSCDPIPQKPAKFSDKAWLREHGVDGQLLDDFLAMRKSKDASNTLTSLLRIKSEAEKACISVEAAVKLMTEHSWRGFKADYVKPAMRAALEDKPADPSVPHEGWRNANGKLAIRFWGEWRDPDGIDPKSGDCWSLVKFTHEKCIYPGRDCSEPIGE